MALHYRTKGFVFKRSDRNESDRVFTVFAQDFGRLEIMAKAIRKITSKLKGGIDIFSLSEIEFIQGKNNKTLTDVGLIDKHSRVILSPDKLEIARQISEVLDNAIKGQEKDEEVFNLLEETFLRLDSNESEIGAWKLEVVYYYFLWNLFSALGYRPEIDRCASCREKLNPYNIYFSNKAGGVICKKCLNPDDDARKINSDVVKILRLIVKKDWQTAHKLRVESSSQKLLRELSDNYYFYLLGDKVI